VVKILTDAACRKFVPGPKRRRIRDAAARSLFLVIEPSGHPSRARERQAPIPEICSTDSAARVKCTLRDFSRARGEAERGALSPGGRAFLF